MGDQHHNRRALHHECRRHGFQDDRREGLRLVQTERQPRLHLALKTARRHE